MKKFYFIYLLSLVLLHVSCEKESFDYQQASVGPDRIDTLIFNPSHYVLNTDGVSTLNLKLLPSYWGNSEKGYTAPIALSCFKPSDYAYYYEKEDGSEVKLESDRLTFEPGTPSGKIKVFARMFGQDTRKLEVELRPGWGENVKEKVIPVVFHIFQYTGSKNTDFVIDPIHIDEKMRKLNNAFSRLVSTGAASTDTKIRFQLAERNQHGRVMAKPGINQIKFGSEKLNPEDFGRFYDKSAQFDWKAFSTEFSGFYDEVNNAFDWNTFFREFNEFYDENHIFDWNAFLNKFDEFRTDSEVFNWNNFLAAYEADWNTDEFLNIWILPVGDVKVPPFLPTVITAGKTPLKGLEMKEVAADYTPVVSECGVVINYSSFVSSELNAVIGKFLGLLPTNNATVMDGDSDYCSDTFLYPKKEDTQETKNAVNKPIRFTSDNIMDGKTQNIAVTNEQAARMHYVLENVPSRKMWKLVE